MPPLFQGNTIGLAIDRVRQHGEASIHDIFPDPVFGAVSRDTVASSLRKAVHAKRLVRCGTDHRTAWPAGIYRLPLPQDDCLGPLTHHLQPMLCGAAA